MSLASTSPSSRPWIETLRRADWLDSERARGYRNILLILTGAAIVVWTALAVAHGGLDPKGKPLGADFPCFYAASRLALSHHIADIYIPARHWAEQRAIFGTKVDDPAFFYPPPYLLICLPLALLPYLPSLAVWMGLSGSVALAGLKPLIPDRTALLALAAYPAVFSNLGHGNNAFLTAGLFAFAVLNAQRRPIIAGLVLSVLVVKPHLALVLPLALLVTGRWKMIAAAAGGTLSLLAVSYLAFGAEAWRGFFDVAAFARSALEGRMIGDEKMQSAFAAVRVLGGSVTLAWTAQGVVTLAACGAMALGLRKTGDVATQAAIASCAALLATPYLYDYDLMLAALPLLWLFREGRRTGFLPWEKSVMIAAFLLPLVSRLIGGAIHVPTGPFVLSALFAVVLTRSKADQLR